MIRVILATVYVGSPGDGDVVEAWFCDDEGNSGPELRIMPDGTMEIVPLGERTGDEPSGYETPTKPAPLLMEDS